jgi:hypothetical protein
LYYEYQTESENEEILFFIYYDDNILLIRNNKLHKSYKTVFLSELQTKLCHLGIITDQNVRLIKQAHDKTSGLFCEYGHEISGTMTSRKFLILIFSEVLYLAREPVRVETYYYLVCADNVNLMGKKLRVEHESFISW